MYIGLKIFPQVKEEYVDKLAGLVDFIEIFAKLGTDYDFVAKYGLPVVVHATHSQYGVNYCNPDKIATNEATLSWTKTLADRFGSHKIIIHPEFIENERCTIEYLQDFIIKHYDKRLLIENTPFAHGENHHRSLCYDAKQIKDVMEKCSIGFCLDLDHAAGSAYGQGIPLEPFVKSLLELHPSHFHISDVDLERGNEVHLNFFEGTMDLRTIKRLIPANAHVSLETPTGDWLKQKAEIEFLRSG